MSNPIVSFDENAMRSELKELVRRTVEDTLSALLEEEADDLIKAERYERTADREACRAGHYERGLTSTSGQVTLEVPRLKGLRFTTAIFCRCKHRETTVDESGDNNAPERSLYTQDRRCKRNPMKVRQISRCIAAERVIMRRVKSQLLQFAQNSLQLQPKPKNTRNMLTVQFTVDTLRESHIAAPNPRVPLWHQCDHH